jgi:hypothetical protein
MKREIGLWVDHSRAVIVTVENEVEVTREIRSNIEKYVQIPKRTRSKTAKPSQASTPEDTQNGRMGDHLGGFYDGIISFLRKADSIYIFGPGEAKVELEDRLKRVELGERIVGIETVKKMTNPQITAKVRDHYLR